MRRGVDADALWRDKRVSEALSRQWACGRKAILRTMQSNLKTMASNIDLVNYIADQCGGAGEIFTRLMFGDYAIYCDGKIFGLISDNGFYLKPTQAGMALLREVIMRPPYEGAKDYFFVPDVDDRDYLSALVRATCDELPALKPKRRKTVK